MPDSLKLIKKLTLARERIEELSKNIEFAEFLTKNREDYELSMMEDVTQALIDERTQVFRTLDLLLPQFSTGKIILSTLN